MMMMMRLKLEITLVLLITTPLLAVLVAASSSLPNCTDRCGEITVPFPFGLGPGCFLDEDYEIVCINNTLPILKKLDLEVMNISLREYRHRSSYRDNTITVRYPIVYSNTSSCISSGSQTRDPVNLTATPFIISDQQNIFAAVGCDNTAIMGSEDANSFVGCRTKCTGNNNTPQYSTCSGYDCCQSTIPWGLQAYNVSFKNNDKSGDCQLAFLVNSSWLTNGPDLYALQNEGYAPLVLEWGLTDITFAKSLGVEIDASNINSSLPSFCYTILLNKNTTRLIQCGCTNGYNGNPYLQAGCQDINECELPEGYKCRSNYSCRNIPGFYQCVPNRSVTNRTPMFLAIGFSSGFGSLLLIALSWWAYKVIKKRREAKLKEKFFKRNGGLILLQQQHLSSSSSATGSSSNAEKGKLFSAKELEKATDNFNIDRVLGQGGQGTVYKGMLKDGRIVAIKKSFVIDEANVEQFINEVVILSQINHRNIVKILGYCLESEVPLLVYEFIPNGTLYRYLHDPNQDFPLSWKVRLKIATEIASALSYLHSSASIPVYHRDIKTTNILLDEQYRAKIADFGTSRLVALDQTHVTTLVQGTFGYLDPEYFQTCQFTDKSDVYSFGVVLVELLTGQKAVSSIRVNEGRGLATFFIISMEENCLFGIVDAQVLKQGGEEEITTVANLAKRCLNLKGRKRPTMKQVVMELEGIRSRDTLDLQQPQQTDDQQVEAETSEAHDAFLKSRASEIDADTFTFSNIHPLLLTDTL